MTLKQTQSLHLLRLLLYDLKLYLFAWSVLSSSKQLLFLLRFLMLLLDVDVNVELASRLDASCNNSVLTSVDEIWI